MILCKVGRHRLTPIHRNRHWIGRPTPIPTPTAKRIPRIPYRRQLHLIPINIGRFIRTPGTNPLPKDQVNR